MAFSKDFCHHLLFDGEFHRWKKCLLKLNEMYNLLGTKLTALLTGCKATRTTPNVDQFAAAPLQGHSDNT
jgi:hypothetical protein